MRYFIFLSFVAIFFLTEIHSQDFWKPLNGPQKGQIRCIAINAQNHIFCKADSLWRSNDNGVSWFKTSPFPVEGYVEVYAISFSSSGNIYLSTQYEIIKSTNDGAAWERVGTGLSGYPYGKIVFNSSGHLFIGSSTKGIFKSTNDGATFESCNDGLTNLKVTDLVIKNNDYIFAATDGGGVYLSKNNGASWTAVNGTMSKKAIYYVTLNSLGTLICSNVNGRIFTTTDDGGTWKEMPTITFSATPRVFLVNSSNHIYTYMLSVMYRTTNDGVTWENINTGLTGGKFESSAINSNGYIFLGDNSSAGNVHCSVNPTTGINKQDLNIPSHYWLGQNYPNPFNPSTKIYFSLPFESNVKLEIFNIQGEKISELVNTTRPAGNFVYNFEAGNLASGVYFYNLTAVSIDRKVNFRASKKLIVMK